MAGKKTGRPYAELEFDWSVACDAIAATTTDVTTITATTAVVTTTATGCLRELSLAERGESFRVACCGGHTYKDARREDRCDNRL